MTKVDFFTILSQNLKDLSKSEISEHINFYNEMIDDRMEEGLSEEEAVAAVGNVYEISAQIKSEFASEKIQTTNQKKKFKTWEIVLLALGFPIWFSLLVAAFAVVISVYAVLWSIVITAWALFVSFIAFALYTIASFVVGLFVGWGIVTSINFLGVSLFCAGLSILVFLGCKAITKGIANLTEKTAISIKKLFVKKEAV